MKMTLKHANWACLLAFVLIFAACKKEKEEEVVPEPIVGVTVENGDADVTIDQQEKRIDVTFYAYCDLSEVLVSFDLIEGAQMFIPYLKDTVYMDLSKEKGATVAARVDGQTVVYTMFATIEYALAGVQVKAGDVDGEVTLYREDRVVRVVFDRPVDLSRVDVTFLLGASGTLVDPQSNPVTMDLTEPARFTVASERAGETVYTIEAEIDMGFVVPDGWTEVKDYELPYYMRLYRADDLAGAEAYALVADTNAVFTVTGGGVMQQATMPEYYERNSSSVALINGGTGDDLLVVDGMLVQGKTDTTYAAAGAAAGDTCLIGDAEVRDGKAYIGGSEARYAMAARGVLIRDGIKVSAETEEELAARSAMGVTSRGDIVLMICSASALQGSGSGDRSRRDGRFRLCRGRRAGGRSRCLPFLRRRAVASLGRRVCAAQLRRPAEIACRRERGGPESLAYIARKPGVDIDELLVSQPDNGGRAFEIADCLIRSGHDRYHRDRLRDRADVQG